MARICVSGASECTGCMHCYEQEELLEEKAIPCRICGMDTEEEFCDECKRVVKRGIEEMAEYFGTDVDTVCDLLAEIL